MSARKLFLIALWIEADAVAPAELFADSVVKVLSRGNEINH